MKIFKFSMQTLEGSGKSPCLWGSPDTRFEGLRAFEAKDRCLARTLAPPRAAPIAATIESKRLPDFGG